MPSSAPRTPYKDFTTRLKLFITKHPGLMNTTLSNIFTMRLIGNKTHGDLAEIAIAEFINQYMYDFRSLHVGKDLYRAKSQEEDITITERAHKRKIPVSLKAYGDGPLQLSTDKNSLMYPRLLLENAEVIEGPAVISKIFADPAFKAFSEINVLPLIYDEKKQKCNILVFDYEIARSQTTRIERSAEGYGRKHPVFRFYDRSGDYICEVRYGDAPANALQRGKSSGLQSRLALDVFLTDFPVRRAYLKRLHALIMRLCRMTRQRGQRCWADAICKKGRSPTITI